MLTDGLVFLLNKALPVFRRLDVGGQLRDAHTLQHPGRVATGHIRIATNPNDADTVTMNSRVFEIDTGDGVTAGNVLVTRGGSAALTAVALAAALNRYFAHAYVITVHGTDTTVIDIAARTPGTALTLATTSGGRMVVQDNAEEVAKGDYQLYLLRRSVTAEDDVRDRVRVDTGLSAILEYAYRIRTSATNNTEVAWDGAVTVDGGVVEFDNTGSTDLAAGHIIHLLVVGQN
jgi:hypothetical protein